MRHFFLSATGNDAAVARANVGPRAIAGSDLKLVEDSVGGQLKNRPSYSNVGHDSNVGK